MAKKDLKARRDHDEDDDPDAGEPIPAGASAKKASHAGGGARSKASHESGHGHGHDDEAIDDEAKDPGWWIPYAVLGGLVLVGVLGFFGAFNPALKPLVEKHSPMPVSSATAQPAPPTPAPPPEPAAMRPAPPAAEGETFGAKHLLVMHKDSRRVPPTVTRTKEEALTRAKEALAKAKAPGAKFEDVVAEYSDEPNAAKRGGNLGNFRRGAMVKEFQEGLEKTKVGEISDIVETPFGYHVILRTK